MVQRRCKICLITTISVVVIPLLSFLIFYMLSGVSYSGTIYSQSIDSDSTITFNELGIPHIETTSLLSFYYTLGYLHGRERLWEMHLKKFHVYGRLAEMFGPGENNALISLDKFMRNMGFKELAEASLEAFDEATIQKLEAYTKGVNEAADSLTVYPLEFYIVGVKFSKWEIVDSAALSKLLSFQLSSHWDFILLRSKIAEVLGKEWAEKIVPTSPDNMLEPLTTIFSESELEKMGFYTESSQHDAPSTDEDLSHLDLKNSEIFTIVSEKDVLSEYIPNMYKNLGKSNSWVIGPELTKTGKPIVSSDPHLINKIPTVWYIMTVSIKEENGEVFEHGGGTMPGLPFIDPGRSSQIGYAATAYIAEDCDIYLLKLNSENTHYLYENEWRPLEIFNETIKVKDKGNVIHTVRKSHHGPVFYDIADDFASFMVYGNPAKIKKPLAFAWTGFIKEDSTLQHFLNGNFARTMDEFIENFKKLQYPLGTVFATKDGDIGFVSSGVFPNRNSVLDSRYIRKGWEAQNDWKEFLPYSDNYHMKNPDKRYIVVANNRAAKSNSRTGIGTTCPPTVRSMRINQMIEQKLNKSEFFNYDDIIAMQNDTYDFSAEIMYPILRKIATENKINLGLSKYKLGVVESFINVLDKWDFRAEIRSKGELLFGVWEYFIMKSLFLRQFDTVMRYAILNSYVFDHFFVREVRGWATDLKKDYCINDETEGLNNPCAAIVVNAMIEAENFMKKQLGKNKAKWEWGRLHTMEYPHTPFSSLPFFSYFYHKYTLGKGNRRTVAVGSYSIDGSERLECFSSPNYRMVVTFDEDTSFIADTGESGDMFSSHYDDMIQRAVHGKLIKMAKDEKSENILIIKKD